MPMLRERGLEAIFGSDHVAKIKMEMKEKYPLKGDPSRKMLDEIDQEGGEVDGGF